MFLCLIFGACVCCVRKLLLLHNRTGDSMSINLSVIFYGKGVPRRPRTCRRREDCWGRSDGEGRRRISGCWHGGVDSGEVSGMDRHWEASRARSWDEGRGAFVRSTACIHLWPARGGRRSRSVRRLKVAGHVTEGAHPLAAPCTSYSAPYVVWRYSRVDKWLHLKIIETA